MEFTLLLLGLTAGLLLQSCYSSTAIKGTPVGALEEIKRDRLAETALRKAQREELARMSAVKENEVFKEIDHFPEYRIGPSDVLEIHSHVGEKVNTTSVVVNSRGKISYSFIDDLPVAGLTPSELDETLTRRLSGYIRNPRIDITVKEFNSKSALVLGEFASLRTSNINNAMSGKITLQGKTTLLDLLALAGGYTIEGDVKNMKLMRDGNTYWINLFDIIQKGDAGLNVVIDDGDVLDIPELPEFRERVFVMGEVEFQGVYDQKDARDVISAISLAGNVTRLAKEQNTLIIRAYQPGEAPSVMMVDVRALFRKADFSQNVSLRDGDIVYVPRMLIGDINDWIANTLPLLDLMLYPRELEDAYFLRRYLHFDSRWE